MHIFCLFLQATSSNLGSGKIKVITKEEALLSKDIEVSRIGIQFNSFVVRKKDLINLWFMS